MSNRQPRYRSFRKAYGGDPDSAILRDLHKRLTRVELDLALANSRVEALMEHDARCAHRWKLLLAEDEGVLALAPRDEDLS